MSPKSKQEYTALMAARYKKAALSEKTAILNEYCKITTCHRKHAIRKLNHFKFFQKPKSKSGRPQEYHAPAILEPLKKIWLAANLPCGKRLQPILNLWLPSYAKTYGPLDLPVIKALKKISAATIDRILKPSRPHFKKRGHSATKSGTLLRKQIPIKTDQWDERRPGFIESDTVHHCGDSMAGHYAITVNSDDIASGWTEQRAVWGKGEEAVFHQTKDVERSLPFPILGFDSDNGGEFINKLLFDYFTKRPSPVQFTRSRAYHTQDNAHIEQKNYTHVRLWLGYGRFDNPQVVPLLNHLYKNEWRLFHNFFCPSVKLIEKKGLPLKLSNVMINPKHLTKDYWNPNRSTQKLKNSLKYNLHPSTLFNLERLWRKKLPVSLKSLLNPNSPGNILFEAFLLPSALYG